jgi:hypothetical protein
MRRLALVALTAILFGVVPAVSGCKKKQQPPSSDNLAPPDKQSPVAKGKTEPGKRAPRPVPPPEKLTYDPNRPDIQIDLFKEDLAKLEGKIGKVVEARGRMGGMFTRGWPDEPDARRLATTLFSNELGRSLTCITRVPIDWRKACPGKTVTIVGILDTRIDSGFLRLRDAYVKSVEGPDIPQLTAEQLCAEFVADQAAFDKKYKTDYYCYVTGTLKKIIDNPIRKDMHAYQFFLDGGPVEVQCFLDNERDVDTTPPEEGQKVVLLVRYSKQYDTKIKNLTMSGVYVGKAP